MAPPLASKRALPPDLLDAGNRVSKPKSTTGKATRNMTAKVHLLSPTLNVLRKDFVIEKALSEMHGSSDRYQDKDSSMEIIRDDEIGDEISEGANADLFVEEFPTLSMAPDTAVNTTRNLVYEQDVKDKHIAAGLMDAIKGLLDLTNDYLKNLEAQHPGVGADFLALLADGASRALRGERVYSNTSKVCDGKKQDVQETWAEKAKNKNQGTKVYNLKRQVIKASAPESQSKEYRRIMIRLDPEHEARKTGPYELRQSIQNLVSDSSLVSDVWIVPSGVAILAPTPAKAAAILQSKSAIENRFGNATVE